MRKILFNSVFNKISIQWIKRDIKQGLIVIPIPHALPPFKRERLIHYLFYWKEITFAEKGAKWGWVKRPRHRGADQAFRCRAFLQRVQLVLVKWTLSRCKENTLGPTLSCKGRTLGPTVSCKKDTIGPSISCKEDIQGPNKDSTLGSCKDSVLGSCK